MSLSRSAVPRGTSGTLGRVASADCDLSAGRCGPSASRRAVSAERGDASAVRRAPSADRRGAYAGRGVGVGRRPDSARWRVVSAGRCGVSTRCRGAPAVARGAGAPSPLLSGTRLRSSTTPTSHHVLGAVRNGWPLRVRAAAAPAYSRPWSRTAAHRRQPWLEATPRNHLHRRNRA